MDQSRIRGLAAVVISASFITPAAVGDETAPPVSGVGGVGIAAPTADAGPELADPTAIAARIAARLDARDVERPSPDAPPEALESEARAVVDTPLPAPKVTGNRLIDRFDASRLPAGSAAAGSSVDGVSVGWWNTAEFRVGVLLVSFVGLAILARRWSNTRGPRAGRPSGVLSVLARYPFGRGASLVLLEVGPRVVLVHQQGGRGGEVRPVAEFSTPEEIAEIRTRLGIAQRADEPGFGRDLEQQLGLYDRRGRPAGFGGADGLPLDDAMETVDLTRRRPRRGTRTN